MRNPLITDHSHRQLHSFLDELKNGTQNYRTVSSLGEQVAQEYRGRCVIELMQNAHDALREAPADDPRSITLVLRRSPAPVLLAANSGEPFRDEEFRGICLLGQSPKDPNKSVGNKGLGFRSVLEVSSCPEVWSTAPADRAPPFRFGFRTDVLSWVMESLKNLLRLGADATCPFVPSSPLVDWSPETLRAFTDRFGPSLASLTDEVRKYLSPYQFPLELGDVPGEVQSLLDAGHKSVIRLPIDGGRSGKTEEAVRSILDQFQEIDSHAMIFLTHVRTLTLVIDGVARRFRREASSPSRFDELTDYQRVDVHEDSPGNTPLPPKVFHLWQRSIGTGGDSTGREAIRNAVRHLPNRWPEVRTATVGIATEETDTSSQGRFVIFLPTTVTTGTGAFINAPFFGSLDRRFIQFGDPYNGLLWGHIVRLGLRIIRELASTLEPSRRAQAIVDIAGSNAVVPGLERRILDDLVAASQQAGPAFADGLTLLCRGGWAQARKARSPLPVPDTSAVTAAVWKEHAQFAVLDDSLQSRQERVRALAAACGGTLTPSDAETAATIGALAAGVQDGSVSVSWQGLLQSVVDILPEHLRTLKPHQPDPLRDIKFLPAQSGQLLSASGQTVLFFQPKRGADEGRDFAGDVPASIQDRVAFLHKDVITQEGPQGRNTPVHKFLDSRFAREFRRDDILRRVVEPAIPKLPIAQDAADAPLCGDLLAWTLKLLGSDPPQSLAAVLQRLPVPCFGGWYPMRVATFGPGWGPVGDAVKTLAEALPEADRDALLSRALLPPSDPGWSGTMPRRLDALVAGGVVQGLRLRLAEDLGWAGTFVMAGSGQHQLPAVPAPGFLLDIWNAWRQAVRDEAKPRYEGYFSYRLSKLYVLRELVHAGTLPAPAARALSDLLLASLPHWPSSWSRVELEKTEGMPWSVQLKSPLRYALRAVGWLSDGEPIRPIGKRWFVREALLGPQRERFSHLRPLSLPMARRLAAAPELLTQLSALGLHTFPMDEERIGPGLLDALAAACDNKRIPPQRLDVFLGQVRDGWRHFDPSQPLPQRFVVSAGRRHLKTCAASELGAVYLPDSAERVRTLVEHGKLVLEMRGDDAHRLSAKLVTATPLRRASRLKERALLDGIEWDATSGGGVPILFSPYAWVPPVLLAIAAFGGATSTGSTTRAWNEAAERLRRARVVECERIALDLWDEEASVASSEPAALWLGGEILAVCRRAQADYSLLAEALQASLGRLDLIRTLRLVLRELNGKNPPGNEDIERALGFAEIDAQSLADVRHRWSGSVSLLVDRLRPVLAVLNVGDDGLENAQRDESQLGEWLASHVRQWDVADLIQAARRSRDDAAMGRRAHEVLGEVAELPQWNAALRSLGERYLPVRNDEAAEQAKAHLRDIMPELRALTRGVAISEHRPERFVELEKVLAGVRFPPEWADQWWRVPLSAVGNTVADALAVASVDAASCAPLRAATSVQQLRENLLANGVDLAVRPFELAAENLRRLKAALAIVQDVHTVWLATRGVTRAIQVLDAEKDFAPSGYIERWNDAALLARSLALLGDTEFTAACQGCARAEDVQAHLGLTRDEVEKRQQQRQSDQAEAARKRRTFQVAGGTFEVGKDAYGDLFGRLRTAISLENTPDPTADTLTPLGAPAAGNKPRGGSGGFGKSSHLRPSAEAKEIVGTVGEILAYHFLRAKFGEAIVTRESWVSETRLKVLPLVPGETDTTSDGYGWDFFFRATDKDWHVEVKATAGDDEEFEMGISEIEAASRLAGTKSKIWRILRISQALSPSPRFDWLPNPFDAAHRALYRIDRTTARVTYARKRS